MSLQVSSQVCLWFEGGPVHDSSMRKLADSIWLTGPVAESDRPVLAIVKGASRSLMVDCPAMMPRGLKTVHRRDSDE